MRRTSSEPLREEQRRDEVHREKDREDQSDDVLGVHRAASSAASASDSSNSSEPMIRSQPHTNPTHRAKNPITVTSTQRSAMCPSYAFPGAAGRALMRS